jgi:hypothetical protein
MKDIRKHEVHRTEAKHRHHVRAVHQQRIPGHSEDCRNRVEGENDVCRFDDGKSDKQRSGDDSAAFTGPKLLTSQYRADVYDARDPPPADIAGRDVPFDSMKAVYPHVLGYGINTNAAKTALIQKTQLAFEQSTIKIPAKSNPEPYAKIRESSRCMATKCPRRASCSTAHRKEPL